MSTFGKKVISAVAGLAVVSSIVSPIAGVSAAMTGVEAANELALLGVIVDQSANPAEYELGNNLKRREAVKVMMNLSPVAVVNNCEGKFKDLKASDWACKYAETALANNMVAGNDMFRPDDMVSKIEGLKMVFQARGLERETNVDWRAGYVEAALKKGVIESKFTDYNTNVKRGEMFVWAVNAIKSNSGDVTDGDDFLCEILGNCEDNTGTGTTNTGTTNTGTTAPKGTASLSLSPESPTNGLAAVNTPRVAMLTFDVTAGSSDVTLNKAELLHVGLGNRQNIKDVAIYDSKNVRVSKQRSFSNNDLELSFERGIVVEAGKTQSFTVAAMLAGSGTENTTYQIELTGLSASATVSGAGIVGAALTPTVVNNIGKLSVKKDTASSNITVGEEVELAGFSIKEENDNEDVLIKTITLHQNGSVRAEYLENLTLYADGKAIASDMMVNRNDEVVMNINYTLGAKKDVDFKLRGVVTGDVSQKVHFEFEGNDDIYAVGVKSGFNIGFDFTGNNNLASVNIADESIIEGAEINAVFTRSDTDEARIDTRDVKVGTLKLTANTNDYTIEKIKVNVSGANAGQAVENLELDGTTWDSNSGNDYIFTDIVLSKGETKALDITFDVADKIALNGSTLTFTVSVEEIRDEENRITYSGSNVIDVMSTNVFSSKDVDIKSASFDLVNVQVNNRELVLGNNVETVLYKGKINVGDSSLVEIKRMRFNTTNNNNLGTNVTLKNIIGGATLNIGGKTYDARINDNNLDFASLRHEVAAGSTEVEVLLTAKLKDYSGIAGSAVLELAPSLALTDLEDVDGNALAQNDVSLANTAVTRTTMRSNGLLTVAVKNNPETDDNLENTVLAGTKSVVLADVDVEAQYEDIKVDNLKFYINGADFTSTITNARLMAGTKTIASNGIVTMSGSNTEIRFRNSFDIKDTDNLQEAQLVADINRITGEGDQTSATAGTIIVSNNVVVEAKGRSSNDDIANTGASVAGEQVAIVPTKLTFSVVESLNTGTAKVKVTADSGTNRVGLNNQVPEIEIVSMNLNDLGSHNEYSVYNDRTLNSQTGAASAAFGNVVAADRVVKSNETFVFSPINSGTTSQTYKLALAPDAATFKVRDTSGNYLQNDGTFTNNAGTAKVFTASMNSSLTLGTTTITK